MASHWSNFLFTTFIILSVLACSSGHIEHIPFNSVHAMDSSANHSGRNNNSSLRRQIAVNVMPSHIATGKETTIQSATKKNNVIAPKKNTRQPVQRRTKDVEEILSGMAHKDPSQWEATEWVVFLLFISLFGWIACCLCTMCCCGRGGGSNLLGWLCFWEICCRDGRDLDACCDNYICTWSLWGFLWDLV